MALITEYNVSIKKNIIQNIYVIKHRHIMLLSRKKGIL